LQDLVRSGQQKKGVWPDACRPFPHCVLQAHQAPFSQMQKARENPGLP
jgi:hypothetical protein